MQHALVMLSLPLSKTCFPCLLFAPMKPCLHSLYWLHPISYLGLNNPIKSYFTYGYLHLQENNSSFLQVQEIPNIEIKELFFESKNILFCQISSDSSWNDAFLLIFLVIFHALISQSQTLESPFCFEEMKKFELEAKNRLFQPLYIRMFITWGIILFVYPHCHINFTQVWASLMLSVVR